MCSTGFLSTTTATTTTTTPGAAGSSPSPRSTIDLPDVRLDMPQVSSAARLSTPLWLWQNRRTVPNHLHGQGLVFKGLLVWFRWVESLLWEEYKNNQFRGRIGTTGIQSRPRSRRAQAEMECRLKIVPTGLKRPAEWLLPKAAKAKASLKPQSASQALPHQTTHSQARAVTSTQQKKGVRAKEVKVANDLGSAKVGSHHHPPRSILCCLWSLSKTWWETKICIYSSHTRIHWKYPLLLSYASPGLCLNTKFQSDWRLSPFPVLKIPFKIQFGKNSFVCVCGGAKEYIHFNLFHISLDDQHPIVLPGGVQYCKSIFRWGAFRRRLFESSEASSWKPGSLVQCWNLDW